MQSHGERVNWTHTAAETRIKLRFLGLWGLCSKINFIILKSCVIIIRSPDFVIAKHCLQHFELPHVAEISQEDLNR